MDIDLAAYRLLQEPLAFDVIATSNLFGDVLADLGAVLLSSRGMSFSGNFSDGGIGRLSDESRVGTRPRRIRAGPTPSDKSPRSP